jgi:arylsulfatase A-like enzyme
MIGTSSLPFWCTCVLAITAMLAGPIVRAADAPPNLLVIMTDDQAQWSLGVYGNTDSRTPNMDRIGVEGAIFTNAFVNTPVCSPSRATFLTGKHGTQLGITDWINPREAKAGVGIPNSAPTWPSVLQKKGYRTGLIGKWHLGEKPQFHPTKNGFDHFMGFLNGGEVAMNANLEVEGVVKNVKGPIPDRLADDALKFIEKDPGKPFALCLFFREPHVPYGPVPEEDSAPFQKLDPKMNNVPAFVDPAITKERYRKYYASIHAADRNIGRVLAKLDELKLADNTIVLFTSDHGYNLGQHGVYTKGNGSWTAGTVEGPRRPNMFEESIRVPLLVRWPKVVKPGTRIEAMVSNLDTFPSILGMLKVTPPTDMKFEGLDFSPLLSGFEPSTWRNAVYGQFDLHNGGLAFMRMVRTHRWKLVRHHMANGLNELYDLEKDPGEKENLYNKEAGQEARGQLQAKLTKWQESIDDPVLKLTTNLLPGIER